VYDLLKRGAVCNLDTVRHGEGRGAGEPAASLGHHGLRLGSVLCHEVLRASMHAHEHRGALPCPAAVAWTRAPAPVVGAKVPHGARVLPRTRT